MEVFEIHTHKRNEMIDITHGIREYVRKQNVKSGILVLYVPHTTAAITINEHADPSVRADITEFLSKLIPKSPEFKHLEGNSDAHIKSTIVSPSISLIIENGDIVLGTWQGIFFCEFDGPRHRKLFAKIIKES